MIHIWQKVLTTIVIIISIFSAAGAQVQADLSATEYVQIASDFKSPTEANHLWCYWYWINDDISRDGITRDLTAMKDVGIGTALIGNINPPEKDGKVPLFSDKWWECMVHAVNEGKRLGVDIGTFNCPGWSQSGGPWVKPEMAMRYLTYSETTVEGPGTISSQLVRPGQEFQDLYVLAFPAQVGFKCINKSNSTIKVSPAVENAVNWIDEDFSTAAAFEARAQSSYSIEFESETAITARSLTIYPTHQPLSADCELYANINNEYKLVKSFRYERSNHAVNVGPIPQGTVAIGLPETSTSKFKLVLHNLYIPHGEAGLTQIIISEKPVLESYIEKQLGKMHPTPLPMWGSYLWEQQPPLAENLTLSPGNVINISDKMDKTGRLIWQVPVGKWTVMRIGMTPTGTTNAPAAPQGKGYEIDKANEDLIRFHFEQYVGKLLEKIPAENRDALKYIVMDSYETGSQNWTDGFEGRFQEHYGYNPQKWLPVLSGVIVGSVEESDRFLWDMRRIIADDVAHEYVGGLRRICNEHNLKTWLENYGHWGFPGEFLMYGGQSDLVSGEFWNEGTLGNIECKAASSCVHTYGKKRCFAEAFTCANNGFARHPALLKKRGDWSFTEGVNQYVLHLFIQQPDEDRIPGINAWFGTEFNRHNTWFKQSRHWMDYNRRCQHMLQQGSYVADVCYFISENAPKMTGVRNPELPQGYSYDYINAEVIVNQMQVKDGKLVLPSGASYSMMVLPPLDTMRPAVIAKLEKIVKAGGVIYGPRPVKSPSMQNYPECDRQVQKIADQLWGSGYSKGQLARKYGLGQVFNDSNLGDILKGLRVYKDFELQNAPVLWTHRTMPGMEIYFITNQSDSKIDIEPKFRVSNMTPQLWDAIAGDIRILHEYKQLDRRTVVPMTLEPGQSQFVVFANQKASDTHTGYVNNFPARKMLSTIEGPWKVEFVNQFVDIKETRIFNKLINWADSDDEAVKYFSGTAIYTTDFTLGQVPANNDTFINLGKVGVMAEVTVNGKNCGGSWFYPYILNVTDLVKPGTNTVRIEVVNLWRNFLVKEQSLPEDQRKTWLEVSDVNKGEALQLSGLIGPVTLETISREQ